MRKRTLTLRRETLSELTADELGGVVGGNTVTCPSGFTVCGMCEVYITTPTINDILNEVTDRVTRRTCTDLG